MAQSKRGRGHILLSPHAMQLIVHGSNPWCTEGTHTLQRTYERASDRQPDPTVRVQHIAGPIRRRSLLATTAMTHSSSVGLSLHHHSQGASHFPKKKTKGVLAVARYV